MTHWSIIVGVRSVHSPTGSALHFFCT